MDNNEQASPVESSGSGFGKLIGAIVVIIIIAIVGWMIFAGKDSAGTSTDNSAAGQVTDNTAATSTTATTTPAGGAIASTTVTVILTDGGFSPKSVTIKKGDTVKWVNQSSEDMWVGSAMHPTHTVYSGTTLKEHCPDADGTAFDQCAAGDGYTFTFEKVGSWNYHNHKDSSQFGTVIVQ